MITRIEMLRKKKGVSLRTMSKQMGIHFTRIFRHEKRKEMLFPGDVKRYSDFFGIETEGIADAEGFARLVEE